MAERDDAWELLAQACGAPCRRLELSGRKAFVLEPPVAAPGRPWVFYAPTLDGAYPTTRQAWVFGRALGAGITVTGMDIGESYGNPRGRGWFTAWYEHATAVLGLAPRACLVPQSRGGLMLYNWAAENPQNVAGVVGIHTVCDLRSYPGLQTACATYGMSEAELAAQLGLHNPVDRLEALARRQVPVWHVHGDRDTVVPLEANAGELVGRYRALGGPAELLEVPGFGHEEHGVYFERQEVVDAICAQALAGAVSHTSP